MVLHVLFHIFHMFFKAASSARRRIAHSDIPDPSHLQEMLGDRINELQQILQRTDPAELRSWRSFGQNRTSHNERIAQQYLSMAKTLAYGMRHEMSYDEFKNVFQRELQLWFGDRPFLALMRELPEDPLPTIYRWRQTWPYR